MYSLRNHILSLVAQQNEEHNKVGQNKVAPKPTEPFRMTKGIHTLTLSDALHQQLTRYCEANPTKPHYKKDDPNTQPAPMPRSKVIRRAVYELMSTPSKVNAKNITTPAQTPERPNIVSWTMPQGKPQDSDEFYKTCRIHEIRPATFVRRALYLYTIKYKSTDPDEQKEAMRDAWM